MPDTKPVGSEQGAHGLRSGRLARKQDFELRPQGRWEGCAVRGDERRGDTPGGGRGGCSVARACLKGATPGELGWRVHGEAMEI
jgi:hypothetical protein